MGDNAAASAAAARTTAAVAGRGGGGGGTNTSRCTLSPPHVSCAPATGNSLTQHGREIKFSVLRVIRSPPHRTTPDKWRSGRLLSYSCSYSGWAVSRLPRVRHSSPPSPLPTLTSWPLVLGLWTGDYTPCSGTKARCAGYSTRYCVNDYCQCCPEGGDLSLKDGVAYCSANQNGCYRQHPLLLLLLPRSPFCERFD